EVDLLLERLEYLQQGLHLGLRTHRAHDFGLPEGRRPSHGSEPGPEAHRQGRPVGQRSAIVIEETIQEWQPDADCCAAQHAAQHSSAADLGTHRCFSYLDATAPDGATALLAW